MKNCLKCQAEIPNWVKIDGKSHSLSHRKYCFICSPFGSKNTKQLHIDKIGSARDYKKMTDSQKNRYNQRVGDYCKTRRLDRKRELLNLLGGCCSACGYDKNQAALNFHHINPETKSFNLSVRDLSSRTFEILLSEVKKCSILCSNCHAEHHYPEHNKKEVPPNGVEPV